MTNTETKDLDLFESQEHEYKYLMAPGFEGLNLAMRIAESPEWRKVLRTASSETPGTFLEGVLLLDITEAEYATIEKLRVSVPDGQVLALEDLPKPFRIVTTWKKGESRDRIEISFAIVDVESRVFEGEDGPKDGLLLTLAGFSKEQVTK